MERGASKMSTSQINSGTVAYVSAMKKRADFEAVCTDTTMMEAYDKIHGTNPPRSLLSLPGEIKNRIYRYALLEYTSIKITSSGYIRSTLLQTCKEVRGEALKIYYLENKFSIGVDDFDSALLYKHKRVLTKLGLTNSPVSFSFVHSNPEKAAHWTNLLEWLQRYHSREVLGGYFRPSELQQRQVTGSPQRYMIGAMFETVFNLTDQPWAMARQLIEIQRPVLVSINKGWAEEKGKGISQA